MKKSTKLTLLIIILSGLVYIIIDSKLYYYGRSNYNVFGYSLPIELNPNYPGFRSIYPMRGFAITGSEFLIAKGSNYEFDGNNIVINEIIKYGFNDEGLITLIDDILGNHYYIRSLKNIDPQSKKTYEIKILSEDIMIDEREYKWINIKDDEKKTDLLLSIRFWIVVFSFFIISLKVAWSLIWKKIEKLGNVSD